MKTYDEMNAEFKSIFGNLIAQREEITKKIEALYKERIEEILGGNENVDNELDNWREMFWESTTRKDAIRELLTDEYLLSAVYWSAVEMQEYEEDLEETLI